MVAQRQVASLRMMTREMQWSLRIAAVFVLIAGGQLFVLTEFTETFFAWTINPPLTAAFLGAGYWAACVFEFLASRERTWLNARIALPTVLVFTTLTLVATLLHLDRFHLSSSNPLTLAAAWAWLAVYAIVPPLMVLVLIGQLRRTGTDVAPQVALPVWMRLTFALQAFVFFLLGAGLFLAPEVTKALWPWMLTPLTGRAVGAWLLGFGVAAAQAAWENDLIRARILFISEAALGLLELVALLRYPANANWSSAAAWIYLAFLFSVLLVGLSGWNLFRAIGRRRVVA